MGRPALPDKVKKATGTLRKDRIIENQLSLNPLTELPPAPEYFTQYEREFFERVAGALFNSGILREVDVMQIEMNALWWHVYKINREKVANDSTQVSEKGWAQVSGYLTAVEKASKMLQWFSDKYGLNLLSKDRISVPKKKNNEIADLLRG